MKQPRTRSDGRIDQSDLLHVSSQGSAAATRPQPMEASLINISDPLPPIQSARIRHSWRILIIALMTVIIRYWRQTIATQIGIAWKLE